MKKLTKKALLKLINEKCDKFDEIVFISQLNLTTTWWCVIIRKNNEYICYKNTLDWIDEIYRIDFIKQKNALNSALSEIIKRIQ